MVVSAYLSRNDHNIFALDWSNYSSGSYVAHAVPSVIGVSLIFALFEPFLTIISHSLEIVLEIA